MWRKRKKRKEKDPTTLGQSTILCNTVCNIERYMVSFDEFEFHNTLGLHPFQSTSYTYLYFIGLFTGETSYFIKAVCRWVWVPIPIIHDTVLIPVGFCSRIYFDKEQHRQVGHSSTISVKDSTYNIFLKFGTF